MSTLTDRYVYAATRFVQDREERTDLEMELRERIEDTVAGLGDAPPADAEREALTSLGDPLLLSARYRSKPSQLIGPRFFYTWLRLLVLIASIAAPITGVISALAAISAGDAVGEVLVAGVGSAISVAIHVAFWVTLFFAVAERLPAAVGEPTWTVDLLPEMPTGDRSSRRVDLVASIAALTVTAALLVWQHLGSPFQDDAGRVPVLDPALWWPWLAAALALLLVEGVHALWLYRDGWTWPVATASAVIGAAFAAVTVPLLWQDRLLNPDLVALLGWTGQTATPSRIAAGAILAVTAWELGAGFVRAARAARRTAAPA